MIIFLIPIFVVIFALIFLWWFASLAVLLARLVFAVLRLLALVFVVWPCRAGERLAEYLTRPKEL